MKNLRGNFVPLDKRAEAIAEHLEKIQWEDQLRKKDIDPYSISKQKINAATPVNSIRRPFEVQELSAILKKVKNGKDTGPDCIRMELVKWLDQDNRKYLMDQQVVGRLGSTRRALLRQGGLNL